DTNVPANFETVVASLDTSRITRYQDVIQEELNAALANSIGQLLGGTLTNNNNGGFGENIPSQAQFQQYAEDALSELSDSDAAQPYQAAVEEAERLALELENEFLRIRQQVSDEFEIAYAQTRLSLDNRMSALMAQVLEIREYINDSTLNDEAIRDQQQRIEELDRRATEMELGFNDALATTLVEIVRNATNLYVMPFHEALYTVEEWIRSDTEEVSLPWAEVIDED
ncbi:MAG: hypothetical protein ACJAZF_004340, partial [Granulosicoccus sp.]